MLKESPSIIFMGTPEFAVPSLEAIHREFGIKAVVTVPDKEQGRGRQILPSPVKQKAIGLNLPILQPELLKAQDFISQLSDFKPDIIVVVAFRILPEQVYTLAKIGSFNIHASLLPKYRGAAPINWAIINGERETGLTTFLLKRVVDTGDILLQKKITIPESATAGDLHNILMLESPSIAIDTINVLIKGNYSVIIQDEMLTSPAPKIFPDMCKINWDQNFSILRNFIHGVSPVPGAWTEWMGKRLKILRVEQTKDFKKSPGCYMIENSKFLVQTNDEALELVEIQPEGRKVMQTVEYLRGYRGVNHGCFQ